MTIEDPTLSTLASYDMSGGEAFMGSILLASTILLEMLNSVIPQVVKVYLHYMYKNSRTSLIVRSKYSSPVVSCRNKKINSILLPKLF